MAIVTIITCHYDVLHGFAASVWQWQLHYGCSSQVALLYMQIFTASLP